MHHAHRILGLALAVSLLTLTACAGPALETPLQTAEASPVPQDSPRAPETPPPAERPTAAPTATPAAPILQEMDGAEFFGALNGAAVLYDPAANRYEIYNPDLAQTRRSPCSTFKILSSLIGLETGGIDPQDSTRAWSGETFWNADWNRDIDFPDAFRTSCVWYFREVIDEIGKETMQAELDRLSYGNCDLSDWEGRQNTNNKNPALTGFWIESSLRISPVEQVQVLERIFGEDSAHSEEAREALRQVMRLPDQEAGELAVYGKTGMGKAQGVVVDAWFTGFADADGRRVYFCVYLGETPEQDVSSARAKEIALQILSASLWRDTVPQRRGHFFCLQRARALLTWRRTGAPSMARPARPPGLLLRIPGGRRSPSGSSPLPFDAKRPRKNGAVFSACKGHRRFRPGGGRAPSTQDRHCRRGCFCAYPGERGHPSDPLRFPLTRYGPAKAGPFFLLAKGAGASDLAADGRAVDGMTGIAARAASAHTRGRERAPSGSSPLPFDAIRPRKSGAIFSACKGRGRSVY